VRRGPCESITMGVSCHDRKPPTNLKTRAAAPRLSVWRADDSPSAVRRISYFFFFNNQEHETALAFRN
jgi:hypothetical protein